MSKINNLIKKLCPNGVEKVSLGSLMNRIKEKNYDNSGIEIVYSVTKEKGIVKSDDLHDFNVYSSDLSNYNILRKNQYAYNPARLNIGSIARLKSDEVGLVSPMYIVFELDQNKIDFEYFEHLLFSERVFNNMCSFVEQGARFRFDYKNWNKIIIDLPPLQIQKEIVNILNKFIEMQKVLESELEARKSQYEFWREKLLKGTKKYKLDDIAKFTYGFTDKTLENGSARYIRITDISENGYLLNNDCKYLNITDQNKKYVLNKGDLVVARTGASYGKTLFFDSDIPGIYASFLLKIELDNNLILNRYYWHFSKSSLYWNQANNLVSKAGQPQFNSNAIKKIEIEVPTIDEQKRIISILDKFERLINDMFDGLPAEIELRRKQYEYYRNKLLSFEELSVSE